MSAKHKAARIGAVFLITGFCGILAPVSAMAQNDDLRVRLQRLERDLRDVQVEVFRNSVPSGNELEFGELTARAPNAVGLLGQRVDDIEQGLRRVTGQLEELSFRMNQLVQTVERLQREVAYQAERQLAALSGTGDGATDGLAPGPRPLGTLPPDAGLPAPGARVVPDASLGDAPASLFGGGDPQGAFDAAMELLIQAQYDNARAAFRTFAQDYPDSDLSSQALYWTGDVAYSINKDYEGAARDFAELLQQYPDAQRAPEGMLKLGLSLLALGQDQEGCAALAALPARYPNASATIANRARAEHRSASCG